MLKLNVIIRILLSCLILALLGTSFEWLLNQIDHIWRISASWSYINNVSWNVLLFNIGQRLILGCLIYYWIIYLFGNIIVKFRWRVTLSIVLFGVILPYFLNTELRKYLHSISTLGIYLFEIAYYILAGFMLPWIDRLLDLYFGPLQWDIISLKPRTLKCLIIRFIGCWMISGLITGTLLFFIEYLIFNFHLVDNWNDFKYYSWSDEISGILSLFFFVSLYYFIYLWLFRMIFSMPVSFKIRAGVWSCLFGIGMFFLPFISSSLNFFQSIVYWAIMSIIGLSVPMTDYIVITFLKNRIIDKSTSEKGTCKFG